MRAQLLVSMHFLSSWAGHIKGSPELEICILQGGAVTGMATLGDDSLADTSLQDIRPAQKTLSQVHCAHTSRGARGLSDMNYLRYDTFFSFCSHSLCLSLSVSFSPLCKC